MAFRGDSCRTGEKLTPNIHAHELLGQTCRLWCQTTDMAKIRITELAVAKRRPPWHMRTPWHIRRAKTRAGRATCARVQHMSGGFRQNLADLGQKTVRSTPRIIW